MNTMSATRLNQDSIFWGFAFIAILSLQMNIHAQTCLPEGVKFTSQAQIDAFAVNYPGCVQILGDVLIEEQTPENITNLNGLAQLTSLGGRLKIQDNAALNNLNGLEAVVSIGGRLNISSNGLLSSLEGLQSLAYLGESLSISDNMSLQSLSASKNLNQIQGDLFISANASLRSLNGLNSIKTVAGIMIVSSNENLSTLAGLDSLVSINNDFHLFDNALLYSLSGLKRLQSVAQDLVIEENLSLVNLNGLDSLTEIGGFLQIANNRSLVSIENLRKLTSIGGLLQIYNNRFLKSLSGLDSIRHESIGNLAILFSDILSNCGVQSVCDYLKLDSNGANIGQNEIGCNTREEILDSCARQGVNSSPRENKIVFFPNPTRNLVNVRGIGLEQAEVKITDSLGKSVKKVNPNNNEIDLSILPAGLYFIEISTDKKTAVGAVCKIDY